MNRWDSFLIGLCFGGLLFGCNSHAKAVRVGIIDSGFTWSKLQDKAYQPKCLESYALDDTNGHGTKMITAMSKRLNEAKIEYCIVLIPTDFTDRSYVAALNKAETLELDLLNISIYGYKKVEGECLAVARLLHEGTLVITAAGNDASDKLTYPGACHNDTYKVFNVDTDGNFTSKSNTYKEPLNRAVKEQGVNIPVLNNKGDVILDSGTSVATAITTAKMAIAIATGARCRDSKGFSSRCY